MLSQTITAIIVLPFLEDLGKIISVPFLKVAISAGKVGRPSKPYIYREKAACQGPRQRK